MELSKAAAAVKDVFKGGVTPSAPTNTTVVLASQSEPRPNHGENDGDGTLPESNALKGDRWRTLEEIAARRNAQVQADSEETLPQTDEDGNEVESNPPVEIEGADLDAAPPEQTPDAALAPGATAQPAPAVAAPAAEETREIIVEGRRVQVPLSKIVEMGTRTLQKETAADVRLAQATQILEDAKRVAQPVAQQPVAEALADKTPEELAELIQFGTKEQAADAIKYVMTRSTAPQVKPEEIVRAAQQAVAPAMAFEAGKSFAQKEYGDLLSDPDYRTIFLTKENALRQSGDQRSYEELYKAIGDEMRVKFNRPKPGAALPAAQPSTQGRTMAEKQEAKAKAPAAPRLASARLDGDGTQSRPPTNAEVIDQQRRARGFQPYAAQK